MNPTMYWYGYRRQDPYYPYMEGQNSAAEQQQQAEQSQQLSQQDQSQGQNIPVHSPPIAAPPRPPSIHSDTNSPQSPFGNLNLPPSQQQTLQIYGHMGPGIGNGSNAPLSSSSIPGHQSQLLSPSLATSAAQQAFISPEMGNPNLPLYVPTGTFTNSSSGNKRDYTGDLRPSSSSGMTRPSSGDEGERETSEGAEEKGGNGRYLKQTKRAAQNRAAQQAFRKRKEERVRELEDKEKLLDVYIDREMALSRRERELAEKERKLAAQDTIAVNPSTSITSDLSSLFKIDTTLTPSASEKPDETLAILEHLVTQSIESIQEDSPKRAYEQLLRGLKATRTELSEVKKKQKEHRALVDSLRLSLEDLGAENRTLRTIVSKNGLDLEKERDLMEE